jgi:hypothetical protein
MTIENRNQIPDPLVRAIRQNWYAGSGEQRFASITELIKPTKVFILEQRHRQEITQDASDLIWTIMGSALHKVVEASAHENALAEERLGITINGKRITGGIDLYENGVITDFKFTSVWNYIHGSRKEDWEIQLNCYAYLFRRHGFDVSGLQVIAIFRDWQRYKAEQEPGYPKQVEVIKFDLWSDEEVERYLQERIKDISQAMDLPDDFIPECNHQERWQPLAQYAVYKAGGNRALRVFNSYEEADTYLSTHKESEQLRIITRQEQPRRCLNYCPVNRFCHFFREIADKEIQIAS